MQPKRVIAEKEYITIDGDTFDRIAFEEYGVEEMCEYIMEFNPGYSSWVIFPVGIKLRIPLFEKEQDPRQTAPWKR